MNSLNNSQKVAHGVGLFLKGGEVATAVHMYPAHGDPAVRAFVSKTLRRVCAPLVDMVHKVRSFFRSFVRSA